MRVFLGHTLMWYQKQLLTPHNSAPSGKTISSNFENWPSYHIFRLTYNNYEKFWDFFSNLKLLFLSHLLRYGALVFCKHPQFHRILKSKLDVKRDQRVILFRFFEIFPGVKMGLPQKVNNMFKLCQFCCNLISVCCCCNCCDVIVIVQTSLQPLTLQGYPYRFWH